MSWNENHNRAAIPPANVEPTVSNESVGAETLPRFDSPVHVRVVSYRKRLTDTDGVSVKAVLDGIVRAGVLADDTAKQVKTVTFENRKADGDEKTIIEIVESDNED